MYIKSLIGAAALTAAGVLGAGAASAATPTVTVTASGMVITAHVRGAVGYPTCRLHTLIVGTPPSDFDGAPDGAGNIDISSSGFVAAGTYTALVSCFDAKGHQVYLNDGPAFELPASSGPGTGSLGPTRFGSS